MKPPGKTIFPAAGRQVPFYGLKLFFMSVALFDTFRNGDGWGVGIVPNYDRGYALANHNGRIAIP